MHGVTTSHYAEGQGVLPHLSPIWDGYGRIMIRSEEEALSMPVIASVRGSWGRKMVSQPGILLAEEDTDNLSQSCPGSGQILGRRFQYCAV